MLIQASQAVERKLTLSLSVIKKTEYYQVSASVLDENALQRELALLKQIKDNYPKFLITLDDFTSDHNGIQQINLIDWLS